MLQLSPCADTVQFCRLTETFRKSMLPPASGLKHWLDLDAEVIVVRPVDSNVANQNHALSSVQADFLDPESWGSVFLGNIDVKSQKTPSETWELTHCLFAITSNKDEWRADTVQRRHNQSHSSSYVLHGMSPAWRPSYVLRRCIVSSVATKVWRTAGRQKTNLTSPEIFSAAAIKVKGYKFGLTRLEVSMFITIVTSSCDVRSKVAWLLPLTNVHK
jgi:hypothetical protein